jgi:NIMA (never in mitosis gene a)-related kinase
MKEINSSYIVQFFSSFVEKSKLYIAMEYCSKGDLSTFIRSQLGKPIKEEIIWKFSIQIMIGLRDLHAKKILHRDIKTLNIFLDADQNIRIGDLGVAKSMKTDFTHTIVGTPYYLSPEMC